MNYGVLYLGTDLQTCFGETLARLRPSLPLIAIVQDEWADRGFMPVGTIPADWRHRRSAVHVQLPAGLRFVDVESPVTHQFLRAELAVGLSTLGITDLDVPTIRGPDRRVTQLISEWAYMATEGDEPRYAGIRYESRVRSGWECWALFDDEDLPVSIVETIPIAAELPALAEVARLFELRIF